MIMEDCKIIVRIASQTMQCLALNSICSTPSDLLSRHRVNLYSSRNILPANPGKMGYLFQPAGTLIPFEMVQSYGKTS